MSCAEAQPAPGDAPRSNIDPANSMQHACMEQLAIVEKYEGFVDYVYPLLRGLPRADYVLRDHATRAILEQVQLFIEAGKSGQVSRLYSADAGIAHLRFILRFCAAPTRKFISQHQHRTAAILLAEVGSMLGA
jgi:hypothetical protein